MVISGCIGTCQNLENLVKIASSSCSSRSKECIPSYWKYEIFFQMFRTIVWELFLRKWICYRALVQVLCTCYWSSIFTASSGPRLNKPSWTTQISCSYHSNQPQIMYRLIHLLDWYLNDNILLIRKASISLRFVNPYYNVTLQQRWNKIRTLGQTFLRNMTYIVRSILWYLENACPSRKPHDLIISLLILKRREKNTFRMLTFNKKTSRNNL